MLIDLLTGLAVTAPLGFLVARTGHVTSGGAAVGVLCGSLAYAAFALGGLTVMGVALLLTLSASALRRHRVADHTANEDGDGVRGVANIVATCFVGTLAAVAELMGVGAAFTGLWFVTAIAAGASDTVASELGRTFGGAPRTFPTWEPADPGTPGAISGPGTVAGLLAAAVIAAPASMLWMIASPQILVVTIACTAGSLIESGLATRFERRAVLDNHTLNLINTAASSGIALALAAWT